MLTECLTVTWQRCKGLSMYACKEGGEPTWSKWSKRETNIWMDTEIQHPNPALTNTGHPRFVTAWSTLNPRSWCNHWCLLDTQHWPFPPCCAVSVWDINICLTDAAHKFCVCSWWVCDALLALGCRKAHFSPWLDSHLTVGSPAPERTCLEGREAGGPRGQWQCVPVKNDSTSRPEWSIQANCVKTLQNTSWCNSACLDFFWITLKSWTELLCNKKHMIFFFFS